MTICCSTIRRPAQAKKRPTVLAKPSSTRTQPHMKVLRQIPMAVTIRKIVKNHKEELNRSAVIDEAHDRFLVDQSSQRPGWVIA